MRTGVIAKKLGMARFFDEAGSHVPVTVLSLEGCTVVAQRTQDKDGYVALQLGAGAKKAKNTSKAEQSHAAKAGLTDTPRVLSEVRLTAASTLKVGDIVTVAAFTEGQLVDVIGVTKGKGFQGVVKRFRVAGGPAAHGSMFHRRIGSVGMRQTPGRVWKNQRMPGHMGTDARTVQNLRVVKILAEKNLILVKGAIPGANGDDVIVRSAIKGQPKAAKA